MHRLDADNYKSGDLTILAIPLSLPYPVQQTAYERVDGDFEYQGEYYKLVKQKIENDTLFVACIKDSSEKKISIALFEYAKVANDLPVQSKQTYNLLAKLGKGFSPVPSFTLTEDYSIALAANFAEKTFNLLLKSYPVESPPPKVS